MKKGGEEVRPSFVLRYFAHLWAKASDEERRAKLVRLNHPERLDIIRHAPSPDDGVKLICALQNSKAIFACLEPGMIFGFLINAQHGLALLRFFTFREFNALVWTWLKRKYGSKVSSPERRRERSRRLLIRLAQSDFPLAQEYLDNLAGWIWKGAFPKASSNDHRFRVDELGRDLSFRLLRGYQQSRRSKLWTYHKPGKFDRACLFTSLTQPWVRHRLSEGRKGGDDAAREG